MVASVKNHEEFLRTIHSNVAILDNLSAIETIPYSTPYDWKLERPFRESYESRELKPNKEDDVRTLPDMLYDLGSAVLNFTAALPADMADSFNKNEALQSTKFGKAFNFMSNRLETFAEVVYAGIISNHYREPRNRSNEAILAQVRDDADKGISNVVHIKW